MVKSTVHGSELARPRPGHVPGRARRAGASGRRDHRRDAAYQSAAAHVAGVGETRLSAGLGRAFDSGRSGPGGWRIMHEPELHLGEDIVVPDVAGWRRERLPRIPETWDAVIAPDWVCETLADSTRDLDLNGKRPVYAREGIPHLWLVDPTDRALEAFELHEGQWLQIANARDDEPGNIRPFDAITFSLGNLWP